MTSVIFLDVDGVLNGHQRFATNGYCGVDPVCAAHLSRVLRETGCKLVISSAWRYLLTRGAMTLDGFWYMLQTHGVGLGLDAKDNPVVGFTAEDEVVNDPHQRGKQIAWWLDLHPDVTRYCAVDDMDLGHTLMGIPLVRTDGKVGMTADDADRVIAILNGGG